MEFFAVSNDFNQHVSGGRYLYGAFTLVQRQQKTNGGTGMNNLEEHTCDKERLQRALAEAEAEAEAKRDVGANCEEVKRREDK